MAAPTIPYDPDRVARGAIVQFVGRCAVALLIVGIATFGVAGKLSSQQALHDAKVRGEIFAKGVAAPQVNQALRDGKPGAVRRFDELMTNRIKLGGSIEHIKVWSADGKVIWADTDALVGQQLRFPPIVREQTSSTYSLAWTSSEARSGAGDTLGEKNSLEVFVRTLDHDGQPVVIESYWSADAIDHRYDTFLRRLAPLSLGALALLMVAIVPLGVSLARRLARSTRDRDRMLQHALRASDLERRRMTHTLHDGVIQDLAGLAYLLPSVTPARPANAREAELRSTLVEATSLIKSDVRQLREILGDLYPPSLEKEGLDAALDELAEWAGRSGIDVTVSTSGTEGLEPAYARLAYRVVREGLINVISHSGAEHALVWVRVSSLSGVEIAVRDDGRPKKVAVREREPGHFGLRILRDVMADLGGELTIKRANAGGTELRASLPASSVEEHEHDFDGSLIPT